MAITLMLFFADASGWCAAVVSICFSYLQLFFQQWDTRSLRPGTCSSATALLQEELQWMVDFLKVPSCRKWKDTDAAKGSIRYG